MSAKEIYDFWTQMENDIIFKNEQIETQFIDEVRGALFSSRGVLCPASDDYIFLYHSIRKNRMRRKIFYDIFRSYHPSYSTAIWLGIRHAFYPKQDRNHYSKLDILDFPGIQKVKGHGSSLSFSTVVGNIEGTQANDYFRRTMYKDIFRQTLICECFRRTLDFIKKNHYAKAVLCALPFDFCGEYYHAYVETDHYILDPSINTIFFQKEDALKVLSGRIFLKLTYEEVIKRFFSILNDFPDAADFFSPLSGIVAQEEILPLLLKR